MHKYSQICTKYVQICINIHRYTQIYTTMHKYIEICTNILKKLINICKYAQNMFKYA